MSSADEREAKRKNVGSNELSSVIMPELFSVNVLRQHKTGLRLCKTNCRSIEVPLLFPPALPSSPSSPSSEGQDLDPEPDLDKEESGGRFGEGRKEALEAAAEQMAADLGQERRQTMPITNLQSQAAFSASSSSPTTPAPFQFLGLPLELRLKIYRYLFPPRHHIIATQLPHNGYFYNTSSIPTYSAQSFYPFGTKAPNNLTTYKVLSSNSHFSSPHPTIYPAILGTSKQVREEAETTLYGNGESIWDFGVHLDACRAFWGDRSPHARKLVRTLRLAREIPSLDETEGEGEGLDERWVEFCRFLKSDLLGLRTLDLTVWGSDGSAAGLAGAGIAGVVEGIEEVVQIDSVRERAEERRWREWEWIRRLLQMAALRTAQIAWWGFENPGVGGASGKGAFDSWLAVRMVGKKLVRDRMVREGAVVEGVVVLNERGH